ncbi:MAG: hypothetical protein AAFR33_06835 [Pseudomonadota bacterium]
MAKFIALFVVVTAVAGSLIYGVARTQGLDLFDPQFRMIGLLGLVTTLYAGLRISMFLNKVVFPERGEDGEPQLKKRSAFERWGRSAALDARMDARRARVEAARARQQDSDDQAG